MGKVFGYTPDWVEWCRTRKEVSPCPYWVATLASHHVPTMSFTVAFATFFLTIVLANLKLVARHLAIANLATFEVVIRVIGEKTVEFVLHL